MKIEIFKSKKTKQFYWRLRAANNRIVADGAEGYARRRSLERSLASVQAKLPSAKIVDLTK